MDLFNCPTQISSIRSDVIMIQWLDRIDGWTIENNCPPTQVCEKQKKKTDKERIKENRQTDKQSKNIINENRETDRQWNNVKIDRQTDRQKDNNK